MGRWCQLQHRSKITRRLDNRKSIRAIRREAGRSRPTIGSALRHPRSGVVLQSRTVAGRFHRRSLYPSLSGLSGEKRLFGEQYDGGYTDFGESRFSFCGILKGRR
jgi:hypothetical protein